MERNHICWQYGRCAFDTVGFFIVQDHHRDCIFLIMSYEGFSRWTVLSPLIYQDVGYMVAYIVIQAPSIVHSVSYFI